MPGPSEATWRSVLQAAADDSVLRRDARGTIMRSALALFIGCYLAVVLWRPNSTTPAGSPALAEEANATLASAFAYVSPEALRMSLRGRFPVAVLNLHALAGVVLLAAAFLQKASVRFMLAEKQAGRRGWWHWAHGNLLGPLALLAMAAMVGAGYTLRHSSSFPRFNEAMVLFAAPWVAFLLSIWTTAWLQWRRTHAVLGDAAVKACVAVPLARVLGAALQRLDVDVCESVRRDVVSHVSLPGAADLAALCTGFTDASGYYYGIAASAAVVGLWAITDTVGFLRREARIREAATSKSR
jgi:hypothetical protein